MAPTSSAASKTSPGSGQLAADPPPPRPGRPGCPGNITAPAGRMRSSSGAAPSTSAWPWRAPAHPGPRPRDPRDAHEPDLQRGGCDAGGRRLDPSPGARPRPGCACTWRTPASGMVEAVRPEGSSSPSSTTQGGHGTGLGLSVATVSWSGMAGASRWPPARAGTTVTLQFQAAAGPAAGPAPASPAAPRPARRILLIDDEAVVLQHDRTPAGPPGRPSSRPRAGRPAWRTCPTRGRTSC